MLIRSQSRNALINFNNIIDIYVDKDTEDFIVSANATYDTYRLGCYTTESKAQKVLQLIVEKYNLIKQAEFYKSDSKYVRNVFDMPTEEEVE